MPLYEKALRVTGTVTLGFEVELIKWLMKCGQDSLFYYFFAAVPLTI